MTAAHTAFDALPECEKLEYRNEAKRRGALVKQGVKVSAGRARELERERHKEDARAMLTARRAIADHKETCDIAAVDEDKHDGCQALALVLPPVTSMLVPFQDAKTWKDLQTLKESLRLESKDERDKSFALAVEAETISVDDAGLLHDDADTLHDFGGRKAFISEPPMMPSYHAECWAGSEIVEAVRGVSLIKRTRRLGQKLGSALQQHVAGVNEGQAMRPCDVPNPKITHRKCYEAGTCLCTAAGRDLAALSRNLDESMKPCFKPHTENRTKLKQSYILLYLIGHRIDAAGMELRDNSSIVQMWWHVGKQWLSPWKAAVYQFMDPVEVYTPDYTEDSILVAPLQVKLREAAKLVHSHVGSLDTLDL